MASVALKQVNKVYPDGFHAVRDVNVDIADGEFVVLVGPSGCGKSTTLRMIAGLEEISDGEVRIGDRLVNDVQPGDRDIAMVFQNYALYPHMTVRQNMSFGLRMRRTTKAETEERVAEAAAMLSIESLLDRRPRELSGGQRQRVALGRAIVRQPAVFLFDEPLSNLDAKLRVQMRTEIAALHKRLGATMAYVTHDQVEAMTLGDRLVLMEAGVIQQQGSPLEVYDQPVNRFTATFIGSPAMNLFVGEIAENRFRLRGDSASLRVGSYESGPAILGVRPEDLTLASDDDQGWAKCLVHAVEHLGHQCFAHLEVDGQRAIARLPPHAQVSAGAEATLAIRPGSERLFRDDAEGSRLTCH